MHPFGPVLPLSVVRCQYPLICQTPNRSRQYSAHAFVSADTARFTTSRGSESDTMSNCMPGLFSSARIIAVPAQPPNISITCQQNICLTSPV